ncbi:hypothetical protein BJX68DRAFT_229474 [Aspergillus pseudodeflectus]|uniref:Uncharacterized protein n=1 Tax=Aspergillus pseudodeflectus TaxID=176178 RepID=A0ABR4KX18_9EURO
MPRPCGVHRGVAKLFKSMSEEDTIETPEPHSAGALTADQHTAFEEASYTYPITRATREDGAALYQVSAGTLDRGIPDRISQLPSQVNDSYLSPGRAPCLACERLVSSAFKDFRVLFCVPSWITTVDFQQFRCGWDQDRYVGPQAILSARLLSPSRTFALVASGTGSLSRAGWFAVMSYQQNFLLSTVFLRLQ